MRLNVPFFTALLCAFATAASAQDRPNTILVLDGSGSMWGQIDGVAKITIAQDVVGGLLDTLPADQRLGLTVYGHRERGNCTDIETIVPPGENTRDAIRAAVDSIKPLGKTPMTDSIIAAAESLRYTEDSATVILISDGVETCNPDPCAAARLMEDAGIDFTAHVIGFDVAGDAEALTQMQCIADETGGLFIPAANADELSAALTTVVEDPEPLLLETTLYAVIDSVDGPLVEDPVLWSVDSASETLIVDEDGNPKVLTLPEGSYDILAYRLIDEMEMRVTHVIDGPEDNTVHVVFPEPEPQYTLTGPDTIRAGDMIPLTHTGPIETINYLHIAPVGGRNMWAAPPDLTDGVTELQGPAYAGDYEVRLLGPDNTPVATHQLTVTEYPFVLTAPDSVTIGADFEASWDGPRSSQDYLFIRPVDGRNVDFALEREGEAATLTAPATAGDYEVGFIFRNKEVLLTQPIEVTEVESQLIAPDSAPLGSTIDVTWDGPDNAQDYISVGLTGERYTSYTYTSEGNPVRLLMPPVAGTYELRYQLATGGEIIASKPIEITDLTPTLIAPDTATAGSTIAVGWDGPDYDNDYVSVGVPGERYTNYTYIRTGNPVDLLMPSEPGTYELRYQLEQGSTILATKPIEVTELTATITAPDTAVAGSTVTVGWDGPDYEGDYVSVGVPGERYSHYTYTRTGNPVDLLMPAEPGTYELRYQTQQDGLIVATRAITLTESTGGLVTPPTAAAGETLTIAWDGPDYDNDYIGVAVGENDRSINYTRVREGNPLQLLMPIQPGDYTIYYRLAQDDSVVAANAITLTDIKGSLTAPATATAGEALTIGWDAPGYDNDYIGVSTAPDARSINYTRVREGNPLTLNMPPDPGEYYIYYRTAQGDRVLAQQPITLTASSASLIVPQTATAGETLTIAWDGPNFENDYIGVSTTADGRSINYVRTRTGNPVQLPMPPDAGEYFVYYRTGQGDRILFEQPIVLETVKATVEAPMQANAGEVLTLPWDGPNFTNDYIGVSTAPDARSLNYVRTREGNPVAMQMPVEPGDYHLYYRTGQGDRILWTQPIVLNDVSATVEAPATARMGEPLSLAWDGPNYPNDYIGVSTAPDARSMDYARVREGNPVSVTMPSQPGDYHLFYRTGRGDRVLWTQPVTVKAVKAQLVAPPTITQGQDAVVGWDGPDFAGDRIHFVPVGGNPTSNTRTADGNPVQVNTRSSGPGDYEFQYRLQDGTIIGRLPVTIVPE